MKRTLSLLLTLLLICLAMAACAESAESADSAQVPDTLLERVSRVAEDNEHLAVLTAEDLYDLVGVPPVDYEDFAYLADYDALSGRELIIVRAVDEEAAQRVEEMLSQYLELRMRETRNYLPEAYKALSEAEVIREELLTVLSIAAPDPGEASLLLQEE